ncbi:hypothetical protein A3F58_02260 [Candidatus Roizmanbacteria bacterium RIFCSPHIGHO2_12_FULL_37_9b]|nr:MAG: hypothetical protein A3F58_02260 [Candidatus Roizmanbacteria bacterium RIFCSPHIGHO2_12_FULL_37_9b]
MIVKSKKRKSDITFIIGTFNEEKRITYPIKSFLPYGDVLVVDNYSSDKTVEIARSLGARVVKRKNKGWTDDEDSVNFVLKHIKTDWTYWGGADEMVSKKCLELYKKVALENKYKVVIQRKKTLLYESGTNFIINFINMHFFKRDALDFKNNLMHQKGRFSSHVKPSEILYLPPIDEYSVYHFSVYTSEKLMNVTNIYSSHQAKLISRRFLRLKLIFIPVLSFFWHYILGGLFTLGMRGFIISMQFSLYYFLTYSKAYEIEHNITMEAIEKSFVKDKKTLLLTSPKSSIFKKIIGKISVVLISFLHKKFKFKNSDLTIKSKSNDEQIKKSIS